MSEIYTATAHRSDGWWALEVDVQGQGRTLATQVRRPAAFRVRLAANDNTDLFRNDATFCAQPGTGGVRLASINELGTNIRHYAEEVWVASNGGAHTYDNPAYYAEDVSWSVNPACAP